MLRAGIIGPSGIGRAHLDALRRLGIPVSAVAASTPSRSAEVAQQLGVPVACDTALDLATHPSVDVVHVCTPNALHPEQVSAAIGAGKHVLCEKPLAISSATAEDLLAEATAAGVGHAVAYNYRYFAMIGALRTAISNGELGRVHMLHGGTLSDELLRAGDRDHWMFDPSVMGPSLTLADVGVHWWDLLAHVTGQVVVEAICARQAVTTGDDGGEDSTALMLRLADGAVAIAAISGVAPGHGNDMTLEAVGTVGSASWRQEDPDVLTLGSLGAQSTRRLRAPADASPDGFGVAHVAAGHVEGYLDAFRALMGAVYSGFADLRRPATYPTFADGVRGLKVLEALLESASSGRWEPVT
jgi:predicted dehydrogenase